MQDDTQKDIGAYGFGMKIDGIKGMDCKVCFTFVFIQIIDLYKKSENKLHETLIIKSKKVIYVTHLNTHYTHSKK
jgi:hypothetical protein